jgi:hypothetical protein
VRLSPKLKNCLTSCQIFSLPLYTLIKKLRTRAVSSAVTKEDANGQLLISFGNLRSEILLF